MSFWQRLPVFISASVAAFLFCTALYTSLFLFVDGLFRDQWYWYDSFLDVSFKELLFVSANQHRVVIPGIFIWLDIHKFSNANVLINLVGLLAFLAYASLILHVIYKSNRQSWGLVFFAAAMLFWTGNYTFGRPLFAVTENLMLLFVIAAIFAALKSRYCWAGLFAFMASFSFSLGVLAWPVIAFLLWHRNRKVMMYYLVAGTGILLLYVFLPGGSSIQSGIELKPFAQVRFILAYMGTAPAFLISGFPGMAGEPGALIALLSGLSGLFVFAIVLWLQFKTGEHSDIQLFLTALMMFAILSAVLTAIGRADFDPISVRFINFVVLFWLALVCYLFLFDGGGFARTISLLVLTVIPVFSQAGFAAQVSDEKWKARKALLSAELGMATVRDAKELAGWPYNTDYVAQMLPRLNLVKELPKLEMPKQMINCEAVESLKWHKIPVKQYLLDPPDTDWYQAWFQLEPGVFPSGHFYIAIEGEITGLGVIRHKNMLSSQNSVQASVISYQRPVGNKKQFMIFQDEFYCEL